MDKINVFLSSVNQTRRGYQVPAGTTLGQLVASPQVGYGGFNPNQTYTVDGSLATAGTVLYNDSEVFVGGPKKVDGA